MNRKHDNFVYIIAVAALIIAGMITTAIINAVKNNQAGGDIRAKAGIVNTLKLTGTVAGIDEAAGTFTVENVQFDATSRSGKAVNYGTWTVTPPANFDIYTAAPGATALFTIRSDSFNVTSKSVVASEVKIQ